MVDKSLRLRRRGKRELCWLGRKGRRLVGRVTGWRYILRLLHCSWSAEEDHYESHLGMSKWVVDKVWFTHRIIISLTYYGCLSELELNCVNIVVSGCQI